MASLARQFTPWIIKLTSVSILSWNDSKFRASALPTSGFNSGSVERRYFRRASPTGSGATAALGCPGRLGKPLLSTGTHPHQGPAPAPGNLALLSSDRFVSSLLTWTSNLFAVQSSLIAVLKIERACASLELFIRKSGHWFGARTMRSGVNSSSGDGCVSQCGSKSSCFPCQI